LRGKLKSGPLRSYFYKLQSKQLAGGPLPPFGVQLPAFGNGVSEVGVLLDFGSSSFDGYIRGHGAEVRRLPEFAQR
jgi:hypothetical protein